MIRLDVHTKTFNDFFLPFLLLVESPLAEERFSSAIATALNVSSDTDWCTICTVSCKVSLPVRVSRNWLKLSYAIPTTNEKPGTRSGGEIFEADVKVFVCSVSSSSAAV